MALKCHRRLKGRRQNEVKNSLNQSVPTVDFFAEMQRLSNALEQGGTPALRKTQQEKRLLYEQWVSLYARELFRFAFRLTGKRHVAEDLLQETFTEAWRSIDKQKYAEKARGWLYQILRYRYSHFLRDNRHHRATGQLPEQFQITSDITAHPLERMAEQDALHAALSTLSANARETFLMVFSQGLSCREAAEELNIPLGTVLSRLDSARKALRMRLSPPLSNQEGGGAA